MFTIDGGASQFQNLWAQSPIGSKVEFLLAVVTKVLLCSDSRLHPVSTNDLAAGTIFSNQMVAKLIKPVLVQPRLPRSRDSLAQFEIKNAEAQPAGRLAFLKSFCQPNLVLA